ncbi:MAG: hypothetical protein DHS20C16_24330 [Phycisphaerae bacterium]|nr:MAG: hypothetical protein DHS20C16_24330 [Phycisphaerae bacterium]
MIVKLDTFGNGVGTVGDFRTETFENPKTDGETCIGIQFQARKNSRYECADIDCVEFSGDSPAVP